MTSRRIRRVPSVDQSTLEKLTKHKIITCRVCAYYLINHVRPSKGLNGLMECLLYMERDSLCIQAGPLNLADFLFRASLLNQFGFLKGVTP